MRKKTVILLSVALVWGSFAFLRFREANAIPVWSKKHDMQCSSCHSSWPQLNRHGEDFKLNGYQLPGSERGAEDGKRAPGQNLFLDTGDSSPPISIRAMVKTSLRQSIEKVSGTTTRKTYLNTDYTEADLIAGGTLNKNVSFFIESLDRQGTIGLHNKYGFGKVNLEYGKSSLTQHGVVTKRRNYLGDWEIMSQPVAKGGRHYFANGGVIQIYGRPQYGKMTYSYGISDGNTSDINLDNSTGGMIRGDFGKIALSLNYEGGKYHGDPANPTAWVGDDSNATEYNAILIGAKYEGDAVFLRGLLNSSSSTNFFLTAADESKVADLGFGLEMILVASRSEFGVRIERGWRSLTGADNANWSNGFSDAGYHYGGITLDSALLLADNARLGMRYFLDEGNNEAREYEIDDETGYNDSRLNIYIDLIF